MSVLILTPEPTLEAVKMADAGRHLPPRASTEGSHTLEGLALQKDEEGVADAVANLYGNHEPAESAPPDEFALYLEQEESNG